MVRRWLPVMQLPAPAGQSALLVHAIGELDRSRAQWPMLGGPESMPSGSRARAVSSVDDVKVVGRTSTKVPLVLS